MKLSLHVAEHLAALVDVSTRIPQDTGWDRLKAAIVDAERIVSEVEAMEQRLAELASSVDSLNAELDAAKAPPADVAPAAVPEVIG